MEKRNSRAMAVILFAAVLFIFAMTDGGGQSELAEIQNAMRRLNWLDNLQYSYEYTYSTNGETSTERMDVWADLLTEHWVADYYMIDEDGILPILKQYSDGPTLYHYDDRTGEWSFVSETDGREMPKLDELLRLAYSKEDIRDVVRSREDGRIIISYLFTREFLERTGNERLVEIEQLYQGYKNAATSREERDALELTLEQYRQTQCEDVRITYTIDENGNLQSGVCNVTLMQPEIAVDENGAAVLGKEMQIQYEVQLTIKGYNQNAILDRIEWYREEI